MAASNIQIGAKHIIADWLGVLEDVIGTQEVESEIISKCRRGDRGVGRW